MQLTEYFAGELTKKFHNLSNFIYRIACIDIVFIVLAMFCLHIYLWRWIELHYLRSFRTSVALSVVKLNYRGR